jgi:CubicO group peptidase (beta-lactamase class C family)
MDENLTLHLDEVLGSAVSAGVTPGAVLAVGRHGNLVHLRAYGRVDPDPASRVTSPRTIYDLASLTKVVGTTTAAMILEEEGRLDLDRPIREYLPELDSPEKASITSRMLLTHEAGFEAFAALYQDFRGRDQYLAQINARPLRWSPGTRTEYSDWDLILMQLIVERLTGSTLDQFLQERVFGPLGMVDTGFNPPGPVRERIAPTEIQEFRGGKVHGEVHDENAWALGGVAGHAGLFSTAPDLAIFAQMMLNGGEIGGQRILRAETIARWTARQAGGSTRALGWDTPAPRGSAGRYFSARSFGHTGFTGTSIWMDPEKGLYVVLLTNRVNPTRENTGIGAVRTAVADAVQQAVRDVPLRQREPTTD